MAQIDHLCRHIEHDGFDCGHEHLNFQIDAWLHVEPDPAESTVLVAHERDRLRGFASVSGQLSIRPEDGDEMLECFFVSTLAVDERAKGGTIARDLMQRCYDIRNSRARSRGAPFDATVVSDYMDPSLEERFKRGGFKRLNPQSMLWYRLAPHRRA